MNNLKFVANARRQTLACPTQASLHDLTLISIIAAETYSDGTEVMLAETALDFSTVDIFLQMVPNISKELEITRFEKTCSRANLFIGTL